MEELLSSYIKSKISVTDEEMNTILSYFKPIRLKKNELLLTNGQTSQRTFFVVKGCLRIFFINEEGQDSTRYFAFENWFRMRLKNTASCWMRIRLLYAGYPIKWWLPISIFPRRP